jgi:hypothetical protein
MLRLASPAATFLGFIKFLILSKTYVAIYLEKTNNGLILNIEASKINEYCILGS